MKHQIDTSSIASSRRNTIGLRRYLGMLSRHNAVAHKTARASDDGRAVNPDDSCSLHYHTVKPMLFITVAASFSYDRFSRCGRKYQYEYDVI